MIKVTIHIGPFSRIHIEGELVGWDGDQVLVRAQNKTIKVHVTCVDDAQYEARVSHQDCSLDFLVTSSGGYQWARGSNTTKPSKPF